MSESEHGDGDSSDIFEPDFAASVVESGEEEDIEGDNRDPTNTDEGSYTAEAMKLEEMDEEEDIAPTPNPKQETKTAKPTAKQKIGKAVDLSLPPLSNIEDIFADMTSKALQLGLDEVVREMKGRPIHVATMCSGTESPLISLQLVSQALEKFGKDPILVNHHFSGEIDPVKQAFIERNFNPKRLFRDVREFIAEDVQTAGATTAYGAKIPIPGDLDMLIGGFVCRDLSRLNNRQKSLEAEGESGDTWNAMYNYTKVFRPSIVLIENVSATTAFWNTFKPRWDEIGYESEWLILDTKNYYLPQTRQRMYMVAIQRTQGQNTAIAVGAWKDLMKTFQRQCSSPFEAFIQDDLGSHLHGLRTSEPSWDLCRLRYDRIRSDERLGIRRPISRWSENGAVKPPDFASRKWYNSQPPRVYDAIDIAHLQGSQAGYDSLYKMAVWDVSQNVDRFKSVMGIVPCITPNGVDFVTNKQTALNGSQLLALQGMPLNKLSFTRETQKERQDLAGNAMTTTVIGTAILSALICGRKAFRENPTSDDPNSRSTPNSKHPNGSDVDMNMPDSMENHELHPSKHAGLDVNELLRDAKNSWQLCNCEGRRHIAKSPVQVCKDCGHAACSGCAGNPSHNYGHPSIGKEHRIRSEDFENKWRPLLPSRLKISAFPDMEKLASKTDIDRPEYWKDFVKQAIKINKYMSIGKFERRDNLWKVLYEAPTATLELLIGDVLQWHLYAKCPSTLPGNSPLRKALEHPIARCLVQHSLVQAEWEVFTPGAKTYELSILGSKERTSSWRSRLGLPDYKAETVPRTLDIQIKPRKDLVTPRDVLGKYTLLENCGTAMCSLYKKSSGNDRIFLFLESDPLGSGDMDSFVFSVDHRRLPYGEARDALAQVEASWRPWNMGSTCEVQATIRGVWTPVSKSAINLVTDTTLIRTRTPSASAMSSFSRGDCSQAVTVLDVRAKTRIDISGFSSYSWILEQAKRVPSLNQWHGYTECGYIDCHCAPAFPRTVWSVTTEKNKSSVTACEDSEGAVKFERAMKTRPKVFDVRASVGPTEDTHIQIGINVTSLVHRAKNRLRDFDTCAAWRLVTDHVQPAWEPFPKFTLRSNSNDAPYDAPIRLQFHLSKEQRRSLKWMRSQESKAVRPLKIIEVEEDIHSELRWRAEARAISHITIRGGVLADLPSFGKTVTTIGLIQSEYEESLPDAILRENRLLSPSLTNLIDAAGTLIVCPPHIAKQWRDEFRVFLGDHLYNTYKIQLIERAEQLQKLNIEDILDARVIIVSWRVLNNDNYISGLAQFTAMPEPLTTKGRAFDSWLEYAIDQIQPRIQELKRTGITAFKKNTLRKMQARLDHPDFQAVVPLKIRHGSAYESYSKMKPAQTKRVPSNKARNGSSKDNCSDDMDWKAFSGPLLQMFRFNRLVADEYHYLFEKDRENYPAYASIKRLPAHKRWVLSGTPALANFSDVNQIASLLGATLGRDVLGDGLITKQLEKRLIADQTKVENFLSRTEVRSYQWHQARHRRAQKFLDQFVRQNEPLLGHIECTEILRPVELGVAHRAVYLELSQHLIAQNMQTRKLNDRSNSDRVNRLNASMNNSATAEDALVKCALIFKTEHGESGMETLIARRQDQLKQTQSELLRLMVKAEYIKKQYKKDDDHYSGFKRDTRSENGLGDIDATLQLRSIIRQAEKKAGEQTSTPNENNPAEKLKNLTSELRSSAQELSLRTRSFRFIDSIKKLLPALSDGSEEANRVTCSSSKCSRTASDTSQLFLISHCGHIACDLCLAARSNSERCVQGDCEVPVQETHLLKSSDLGADTNEEGRESYGKKLYAIAELVKQIPDHEQGIVFVPSAEAMEVVKEVFNTHNIRFHALGKSCANTAETIEDFKHNTDLETRKKILILNLRDESSAGVNLINANHVIFVSPLLVENQYTYDSAMTQAIARSRRYRQEKTVHIYHFAALRTIDVDVMEHRHKRFDGIFPDRHRILYEGRQDREKTKLVKNTLGIMMLLPISWLADDEACEDLGIDTTNLESFTSLINFSETFEDEDD
ncbi:hypothetical protein K469DRAFT_649543 [Zopfia rhizophila CBS 207.26]|uniref:Helicase C-terminal domain-containing protein n=1 Tax=Zopfia rhizophila CBS 207.26 TaxID=1314779 RepID=A0A6A6EXI6_9PEZI|nr:hypothetical protein K469DRAFT_649543 [Zopfia rhizophila CBS 207.26]